MHGKYSNIPTQPDSHDNIGITNTLHAMNGHVICGSFKPTNKHATTTPPYHHHHHHPFAHHPTPSRHHPTPLHHHPNDKHDHDDHDDHDNG
jgi:hypothetical protein